MEDPNESRRSQSRDVTGSKIKVNPLAEACIAKLAQLLNPSKIVIVLPHGLICTVYCPKMNLG